MAHNCIETARSAKKNARLVEMIRKSSRSGGHLILLRNDFDRISQTAPRVIRSAAVSYAGFFVI